MTSIGSTRTFDIVDDVKRRHRTKIGIMTTSSPFSRMGSEDAITTKMFCIPSLTHPQAEFSDATYFERVSELIFVEWSIFLNSVCP
jgi:hypothetical protein